MKLKKLFLLTALACGALLSASAQEEQDTTIYEFRPHWYIQGAFGYQYTIGEADAGTLSSPNAQIAFGYNFTPVWGLRFNVNAWQSRDGYIPGPQLDDDLRAQFYAATGDKNLEWKWYYVAPALDVTMDLTNLFGGYKPKRIVNVGLFAGIGANIFFKNDEAIAANNTLTSVFGPSTDGNERLALLWDGCKASVLGQAGITIDFRVTDKFRLGLEGQGNILADRYNSKNAHNPDWYINALVTAKYNFGGTYNERKEKKQQPCDQLAMRPDTVYIYYHDTVTISDPAVAAGRSAGTGAMLADGESVYEEVFFRISSSEVSPVEDLKLKKIADFLKNNPDAKVAVTGYADKATGTAEFNQLISEKRVNSVKNMLIQKYGIDADRITVKAVGDKEQLYTAKDDDPMLNRVSVCVVE